MRARRGMPIRGGGGLNMRAPRPSLNTARSNKPAGHFPRPGTSSYLLTDEEDYRLTSDEGEAITPR